MILKDDFYSKIGLNVKPLTKSTLDTNPEMIPISIESGKRESQKDDLKYVLFNLQKKVDKPAKQQNQSEISFFQAILCLIIILISLVIYEFKNGDLQMRVLSNDSTYDLGTAMPWNTSQIMAYTTELILILLSVGLNLFVEISFLRSKTFNFIKSGKVERVVGVCVMSVLMLIHPVPTDMFYRNRFSVFYWNQHNLIFRKIEQSSFDFILMFQICVWSFLFVLKSLDFFYIENKARVSKTLKIRKLSTLQFLVKKHALVFSLFFFFVLWSFFSVLVRVTESAVPPFVYLQNQSEYSQQMGVLTTYSNSFAYVFFSLASVGIFSFSIFSVFTRFWIFCLVFSMVFFYAFLVLGLRNFLQLGKSTMTFLKMEKVVELQNKLRYFASQIIVRYCKMQKAKKDGKFAVYKRESMYYGENVNDFRELKQRILDLKKTEFNLKSHLVSLNFKSETVLERVSKKMPQGFALAKNEMNAMKIGKQSAH